MIRHGRKVPRILAFAGARPRILLGAGLAGGTFTADLFTPLGVAGGAPYMVLVLLGLWSRSARTLPALAGLATGLTVLGGILSPRGDVLWVGFVNRTLTILATWAIAVLLLRYRQTQRALESTMREREAMARIGQMAAVVAHEVKNPLAGIRGAIQILGSRLPDGGEEQEVIENILERLDSLNRISQGLLEFARPKNPRLEPLRLKLLVRSSAELLAADPEFAGIQVGITGSDGPVEGDNELLQIVFLNLLLNAAHAMGGKGVVRVLLSEDHDTSHVSVEDSGPGIPPEARERVFEPFFTSKVRGAGLGLAITRQVVDAHGGRIDIDCPERGGTRIRVSLPRRSA